MLWYLLAGCGLALMYLGWQWGLTCDQLALTQTQLEQANDLIRRIGDKIDLQEQERQSEETDLWSGHYQATYKERP